MKIALAQIRSKGGDIAGNMARQKSGKAEAAEQEAHLIVFPDLSTPGYEPRLANVLAVYPDTPLLDDFQDISNAGQITIALGMPTRSDQGLHISMFVFQPYQQRRIYSKQYLHEDELPFFTPGEGQLWLRFPDAVVAPAICYESLLPEHAAAAVAGGAQMYIAGVAKSAKGIAKAYTHYPAIARQYGMPVCMVNSIGPNDDFTCAGQSAVWDRDGNLVKQLGEKEEGVLVYNTSDKS